jgi:hypothetical protein
VPALGRIFLKIVSLCYCACLKAYAKEKPWGFLGGIQGLIDSRLFIYFAMTMEPCSQRSNTSICSAGSRRPSTWPQEASIPLVSEREKLIVRHISAHQLRHTFCTMLYYAGFDVLQMQYLMGHDDIKTTLNTYTHLNKSSLGNRNLYQEWAPMLRETLLGEKSV